MNSDIPKVLHKICGKPMISILVDTLYKTGLDDIIVVTGYKEDLVKQELKDKVKYVTQEQLLGTGHAVMQAKHMLKNKNGKVLILYGDVPLVSRQTIRNFIAKIEK